MGLQWATRAKAMDDPAKSRVINKIDWVAPPQGHARIAGDGYAISAFSKQDPDMLFRIIATSADQANMRGAASLMIPPRKSLLDDPELQAGEPVLSGGAGFVCQPASPAPALPEFYAVGEFITRRILQAVNGEMTSQGGAGCGGDRDHGLPQGPRLLQVTRRAAVAGGADLSAGPARQLVAVPGAERARARRGHAVSARAMRSS